MKANFARPTRRATALAAAALLGAIWFAMGGAFSAQAAIQPLPLSDVYPSKTYYSTPRYKPTTGTAVMTLTSYWDNNCGSGGAWLGMRTNAGASGESTQFPWFTGNPGTAKSFRNVSAPPAFSTIFSSGYYYMNAQIGCGSGSYGTWSGSLNW